MSFFDPTSSFNRPVHRRSLPHPAVKPGESLLHGLPPKHAAPSKTELRRWSDRLDDAIRNVEDHGGQPQTVRMLEDLRDDIDRSARMG